MTERELTALVVDDEENLREIFALMLAGVPGIKVITAPNGEEAYNIIKERPPDILYTDVRMPRWRGDQLLEKLVEEGVKIPTFVLSGTTITDEGIRALFYSHRMYTEDQIEKLQLPKHDDLEAQKAYIGRKVGVGDFDFGFNILNKPFKMDVIIDKTMKVREMLYRYGKAPQPTTQQPQS